MRGVLLIDVNIDLVDVTIVSLPLKGPFKKVYLEAYSKFHKMESLKEENLYPVLAEMLRVFDIGAIFSIVNFPLKRLSTGGSVAPDFLVIGMNEYFREIAPLLFVEVEKELHFTSQHTIKQIIRLYSLFGYASLLVPILFDRQLLLSKENILSFLKSGLRIPNKLKKIPLHLIILGISPPEKDLLLNVMMNVLVDKTREYYNDPEFKRRNILTTWLTYINISTILEIYWDIEALHRIGLPFTTRIKISHLGFLQQLGDTLSRKFSAIEDVILKNIEELYFDGLIRMIECLLDCFFFGKQAPNTDIFLIHPLKQLFDEFKRSEEGINYLGLLKSRVKKKIKSILRTRL